jgi:hypothetical protein
MNKNKIIYYKPSIRGVFKKRLNFLSSAPTSKEGALQLLGAPSGRL